MKIDLSTVVLVQKESTRNLLHPIVAPSGRAFGTFERASRQIGASELPRTSWSRASSYHRGVSLLGSAHALRQSSSVRHGGTCARFLQRLHCLQHRNAPTLPRPWGHDGASTRPLSSVSDWQRRSDVVRWASGGPWWRPNCSPIAVVCHHHLKNRCCCTWLSGN